MAVSPDSIDAYLATVPAEACAVLQAIRRLVHDEVPEAVETIGYRMPAFRVERIFLYAAAFKEHVGIYPPVTGDEPLQRELEPYAGPKGNLKFPLDRPLPEELVRQVVRALARQYARR